MIMKALSLTNPWGPLVVVGAKLNETRSRRTNYRGRIVIHASKGYPQECQRTAKENHWFRDALLGNGYAIHDMPCGVVIGEVDIIDCLPVEEVRDNITHMEHQFGNYSDGRFAYILANPERYETPIPAKGMLGLWNWEKP